MREFGPVRFILGEDPEAAKPYIGIARMQLGITKNLMNLGGLRQGSRIVTLADGTVIRSQSVFGQDTVTISPVIVEAPQAIDLPSIVEPVRGTRKVLVDVPFSDVQSTYPSSAFWTAVAWNGTVFVAVCGNNGGGSGNSTKAMRSVDGITWAVSTLPTSQNWRGVAWNGTVFCAIGTVSGGTYDYATSPDGITWTPRAFPNYSNWTAIAWNGSVFCVLGGGYTATSPDGITWAMHDAATAPDYFSNGDIASTGDGVLCTIPSDELDFSYVSTNNGATWAQYLLPSTAFWYSIAWNGTVFCVLQPGTTNAATSPDGVTWTPRTLPVSGGWSDIAWNGTVFCATDGTTAITSPDGITWETHALVNPISNGSSGMASNGSDFCVLGGGFPGGLHGVVIIPEHTIEIEVPA